MKLALLRGTLFELEEAVVLSGSAQSTAVDVLSISSRCALDARTPQDVLHHVLFLQNSAESARVPALGLPSRVLLLAHRSRAIVLHPSASGPRAGTSGCRSIAPETPTPPAEFTLYCTRYTSLTRQTPPGTAVGVPWRYFQTEEMLHHGPQGRSLSLPVERHNLQLHNPLWLVSSGKCTGTFISCSVRCGPTAARAHGTG